MPGTRSGKPLLARMFSRVRALLSCPMLPGIPQVPELPPSAVARLVWAHAKMGHPSAELMERVVSKQGKTNCAYCTHVFLCAYVTLLRDFISCRSLFILDISMCMVMYGPALASL